MTHEEMEFLSEVAQRAKDPDMLKSILLSAVGGVEAEARESHKHAVDMETIAIMCLNQKLYKTNQKYIADMAERWQSRMGMKWDEQIKELRDEN